MKEIKAPHSIAKAEGIKIFFAGSIEMGKAENWQATLTSDLAKFNGTIFNPRRDDWDSSWVQTIKNKQFRQQVEWELNALEAADVIVFYFDPNTQSPITLMELGLHAGIKQAVDGPYKTIIVCCPEGYFRKGNVDILCKKYKINSTETYLSLVKNLKSILKA
jgi:hypothetical protein